MEWSGTEIAFMVLSILFSFLGLIFENSKLYVMTTGHYKLASVFSPITLLLMTLSSAFAIAFSSVSGYWWFILAYAAVGAVSSYVATMLSKHITMKMTADKKQTSDKDDKSDKETKVDKKVAGDKKVKVDKKMKVHKEGEK